MSLFSRNMARNFFQRFRNWNEGGLKKRDLPKKLLKIGVCYVFLLGIYSLKGYQKISKHIQMQSCQQKKSFQKRSDFKLRKLCHPSVYLFPKSNIDTQNAGFLDVFPFKPGYFGYLCWISGGNHQPPPSNGAGAFQIGRHFRATWTSRPVAFWKSLRRK